MGSMGMYDSLSLWGAMMLGAVVSAYTFLMSVSGSVIVHRDQLAEKFSVDWLVHLHTNLSTGETGRALNGIGAIVVTLGSAQRTWLLVDAALVSLGNHGDLFRLPARVRYPFCPRSRRPFYRPWPSLAG